MAHPGCCCSQYQYCFIRSSSSLSPACPCADPETLRGLLLGNGEKQAETKLVALSRTAGTTSDPAPITLVDFSAAVADLVVNPRDTEAVRRGSLGAGHLQDALVCLAELNMKTIRHSYSESYITG